jgi:Flp pilus assembly protein TadD
VFHAAVGVLLLATAPARGQTEYDAAAAWVRSGDPARAIPVLQKIVASSPRDLKARNLLGIALLSCGRKAEASVEFRRALALDPDFAPALKNLAVDEFALGQRNEARIHFERLLQSTPADPVAHFYLGEICFGKGDFGCALQHYEQSGALETQDPRAALRAAMSAVEQNKASTAVRILENLSPDADAQFQAGLLLAKAKDYEHAAGHFLLARPEYTDAYSVGFNLALVYVEGDKPAAAIETGEALAQQFPRAELYNLLARAYEAAGQTQKAYDSLRTAIKLEPRNEMNYVDLMALCLTHENWDLSLEISDIALSRIPSAFRVRLQRGAVLAMKGRLDEAEREFHTAESEQPNSSIPVIARAIVKLEQKQPEQAIAMLRTRRAHHAGDARVDWLLGEALMERSSDREAIDMLQEAIRLNRTAIEPRVLLGKLFLRNNQITDAERSFEEALRLDPNDRTAAYQLAILYRKAGKTAEAERLMQKVGQEVSAPEGGRTGARDLVRILRESSH